MQYDTMHVDDDEWERYVPPSAILCSPPLTSHYSIKLSGEQYDDRIVEVHWDPAVSGWRMMRFRDDKPNANHNSVVENIIESIADGVEKDTVRTNLGECDPGFLTPFIPALVTLCHCAS